MSDVITVAAPLETRVSRTRRALDSLELMRTAVYEAWQRALWDLGQESYLTHRLDILEEAIRGARYAAGIIAIGLGDRDEEVAASVDHIRVYFSSEYVHAMSYAQRELSAAAAVQ